MRRMLMMGLFCSVYTLPLLSQKIEKKIDAAATAILPQVIEWRRHFHQYPELSNREKNTSQYIIEQLKSWGLEIQYPIAHYGIVATLKGGKPGPVIALRADMDALPVTENNELSFASKETAIYNGQKVGVMHACGHDAHIAMLLGAAKVLSDLRKEVPGTIKFIFQPAEEGVPAGEVGGAKQMIKEGVLENPKVEAIYGAHISSGLPIGMVGYKSGAVLASSTNFKITIHGKQSHGARPWLGADPIVMAAQIVVQLQQIVSRELPITDAPAIISVGKIKGGVRQNIIPEEATIEGTIRLLDNNQHEKVYRRIEEIAASVTKAMGGSATVEINPNNLVTVNNEKLTAHVLPALEKAIGKENIQLTKWGTAAEDFSHFAYNVPGFYFSVGGRDPQTKESEAPPHHSPLFKIDDSRLDVGVRAFVHLVFNGIPQP